jgi:hypothetical protein
MASRSPVGAAGETRTIAHLYDTRSDAERVTNELEAAGIPRDDISVVAHDRDDGTWSDEVADKSDTHSDTASGAGTGATAGAVLGGGVGLLAGLGALAIPGIGPVVAAGWLVATLAGAGVGAAAGGLVGSLTGAGVSERQAHVYAEGVRRGGTLVTVRTTDTMATQVEAIMTAHNAADWEQRDRDYRTGGWRGFDPAAPPYAPSTSELERDRHPRV